MTTRSTKGRRFPAEPLTPDEVGRLIAGCSLRAPTGIRNRALVMLLYRSGLRISEALALRPADVSLTAHTARVLHGKGDKATVRGFHPSAADALARWLDTRKRLAAEHGFANGPLFCTLEGGPLSDRYVRDLLKRLAARAGIDKRVHPHGLRHTFAAELDAAGTPTTVISKLLGHSSVAVTARYLDHLTNGQAIAALESAALPPLPAPPASAPRKPRAPRAAVSPQEGPPAPPVPTPAPEPASPAMPALDAAGPEPEPQTCAHERWNEERGECADCGEAGPA